ncbi:cupin domain-containing protein [Photobacterium sp. 53610]|uniref:cupin domain-containing protein n=1 Tax=Photobacterium sp. 53610 TaxID=3102789 RepID=UPI002EDAEF31
MKTYDEVVYQAANQDWEKWSKPGADGRVKIFNSNGKRLRMLELPAGFDEHHLCEIGHQGYVLTGSFTIFVEGTENKCHPGDFFSIPDGVPHRSKGDENEVTTVFVVDDIQ